MSENIIIIHTGCMNCLTCQINETKILDHLTHLQSNCRDLHPEIQPFKKSGENQTGPHFPHSKLCVDE